MWSNSSLLEIGPSSAAEERVSMIAICFPKMTVLMLVWCRAYGCRSVSVGLIFPLFMSVVWICQLKLATHQASFNVFCYILLHARPVCHLLECFIGDLDTVVSCAWCIVYVCQHHHPLAVRYYELWRSEWLRDIHENTVSQMQYVLDRVERAELGGCVRKWEEMGCSNGSDM